MANAYEDDRLSVHSIKQNYLTMNSAETISHKNKKMTIHLETLSKWESRCIFWVFYAVLVMGFVLLFYNHNTQWTYVDFCINDRSNCADHHVYNNSIAISWYATYPENYFSQLDQLFHAGFNVEKPKRYDNGTHVKELQFDVITKFNQTIIRTNTITSFLTCIAHSNYCNTITFPIDISINRGYDYVVNLHNIEKASLWLQNATIDLIYQKHEYTIASITLRYIFILMTIILSTIYAIGLNKYLYKYWLTEQTWVFVILASFIIYCNPSYIAYVYMNRTESINIRNMLIFMEYHLSGYFIYCVQAFILVHINCMRVPDGTPSRMSIALIISWSCAMITTDLMIVWMNDWNWTNTTTVYTMAIHKSTGMGTKIIYGMMITLEALWFTWTSFNTINLYINLKKLDYLATRSRQLSFRFFIFLQTTYMIYLVSEIIFIATQHKDASLLTYRRDQHIGEIIIAFTFTVLMVWIYCPINEEIPNPLETEWKNLTWRPEWFEWISDHGGSLFFFDTENEQETFRYIQQIPNLSTNQSTELNIMEKTKTKIRNIFINPKPMDLIPWFFSIETCIDAFNMSWEVYYDIDHDAIVADHNESIPNNSMTDKCVDRIYDCFVDVDRMEPNTVYEYRPISIERFGCMLRQYKNINGMQYFIATNIKNKLIISFRGTNNLTNLKMDLKLDRIGWDMMNELWKKCRHSGIDSCLHRCLCIVGCDEPLMHRGFMEGWLQLEPYLTVHLRDVLHNTHNLRNIIITGHSMGAVFASMCAVMIINELHNKTVNLQNHPNLGTHPLVYTYGMPRIGNRVFKDMYNELIPYSFRVVNESDFVSQVGVPFMNDHVGKEICIDNTGNLIVQPTWIERSFRPTKKGYSFIAHSMESYRTSLNAVANKHNCPGYCIGNELI